MLTYSDYRRFGHTKVYAFFLDERVSRIMWVWNFACLGLLGAGALWFILK